MKCAKRIRSLYNYVLIWVNSMFSWLKVSTVHVYDDIAELTNSLNSSVSILLLFHHWFPVWLPGYKRWCREAEGHRRRLRGEQHLLLPTDQHQKWVWPVTIFSTHDLFLFLEHTVLHTEAFLLFSPHPEKYFCCCVKFCVSCHKFFQIKVESRLWVVMALIERCFRLVW